MAEGSLFDNIQVYNYQEIQPILEEINSLQKDIFVFRPISLDWFSEDRFKEGQKVLLVTAD